MSQQSVARQYANALFSVAQKSGRLDAVTVDLRSVEQLLESHAELRAVFETPLVPARKKRAVVDALIEASGGMSGEFSRLLQLLADNDRLGVIPAIAAAFHARVMEANQIIRADVVTAAPLDGAGEAAVAAALGRATGRQVTVSARVDPSIIGGVVARVGSLVFDGSVVRQLERLRQRLSAEA